ncbi:MAG: hypothetical protein ACSLE9_02685 [Burkholderiaceae bacterium]
MNNDDDLKFNRRFLAFFAVGLCLAAMGYVVAITFLPIPKDNTQYASTALGFILGTVFATPLAFHFGSSKSSQSKDAVINAQLTSAATAPAAPVKVDDSTPIKTQEVLQQ